MLKYFFILFFCAYFIYKLLPQNRASLATSPPYGGFFEFVIVIGFVLSVLFLSIVILFDLINNFGARGFIIWIVVVMLLFFSSRLFFQWAKL